MTLPACGKPEQCQEIAQISVFSGVIAAGANRGALLANARLADEHRAAWRPPHQHLHDSLDLAVTADHRAELALSSEFGQVAAQVVEYRGGSLAFAC